MSDFNVNPLPDSIFEEVTVYKECRNNHALSVGKVAYDGCQIFLKRGDDNNAENAFLCASCGCHRNFHHRHVVHIPIPQTQTGNVVNTTSLSAIRPMNNLQVSTMESKSPKRPDMESNTKPTQYKRMTYSPEMKMKLMIFANSIGWKMRKNKKEEINNFCSEIGITRDNFISWINNHRYRANQNAQSPKN